MAGLSAGLALHCKGFTTIIYEQSSAEMEFRGAGLGIQADMVDYMLSHGIISADLLGVPSPKVKVLDQSGRATVSYNGGITTFTSWSHIWRHLKNHYPTDQFSFSHRVDRITDADGKVTVHFTNGHSDTADLLVGADGYHSAVRNHTFPGSQPFYAGYVAYRGLVPESSLSDEEIDFFENALTVFDYPNARMMVYLVPGRNGEVERGQRILNWAWANNQPEEQMQRTMMDVSGHQFEFSISPGGMSASGVSELNLLAQVKLPKQLRKLVAKTKQPFAQAIVDLSVPQMYKSRIALIGDAAYVVRPHTASGTAKAYRDAIELAENLSAFPEQPDLALAAWNQSRQNETEQLAELGKQLSQRIGLGYSQNFHDFNLI